MRWTGSCGRRVRRRSVRRAVRQAPFCRAWHSCNVSDAADSPVSTSSSSSAIAVHARDCSADWLCWRSRSAVSVSMRSAPVCNARSISAARRSRSVTADASCCRWRSRAWRPSRAFCTSRSSSGIVVFSPAADRRSISLCTRAISRSRSAARSSRPRWPSIRSSRRRSIAAMRSAAKSRSCASCCACSEMERRCALCRE